MGPKAERKRCACFADLNLRIFFSRSRVGWCEFSARLFNPLCCRCVPRSNTWPNWSPISWPQRRLKQGIAWILLFYLLFYATHIMAMSSFHRGTSLTPESCLTRSGLMVNKCGRRGQRGVTEPVRKHEGIQAKPRCRSFCVERMSSLHRPIPQERAACLSSYTSQFPSFRV